LGVVVKKTTNTTPPNTKKKEKTTHPHPHPRPPPPPQKKKKETPPPPPPPPPPNIKPLPPSPPHTPPKTQKKPPPPSFSLHLFSYWKGAEEGGTGAGEKRGEVYRPVGMERWAILSPNVRKDGKGEKMDRQESEEKEKKGGFTRSPRSSKCEKGKKNLTILPGEKKKVEKDYVAPNPSLSEEEKPQPTEGRRGKTIIVKRKKGTTVFK